MNSEDTIIGGREVTLSNGDIVRVSRWSVRVGQRLLPQIDSLLEKSIGEGGDMRISALLHIAFDEIFQIVLVTVMDSNKGEWDKERVEALELEDVVHLATEIFEECLARPDGGGLMGEMMRFSDRGGHMLLVAALGPERAAQIHAEAAERASVPRVAPKNTEKKSSRRKKTRKKKAGKARLRKR